MTSWYASTICKKMYDELLIAKSIKPLDNDIKEKMLNALTRAYMALDEDWRQLPEEDRQELLKYNNELLEYTEPR